MLGKMGGHNLVAIKTDPHHGHLGTASGFKVTRWAKAGESSTALALSGSDVVMKSR
jgi:hypothetical protein